MSATPPRQEPTLREQLNSLARLVQQTDRSGDIAELRRGSASVTPGFAFWRLLAQANIEPSDDSLPAWIVAASCMAMAHGSHAPTVKLGAALRDAGVDERRVLALLRSHAPGLFDQARSIVHLLSSKGQRFDHADLAFLIVSAHPEAAEAARRHVAGDFFRSAAVADAPH